ncbi:MAG: hypothetical protein WBE48_23520 [Xanthobacteraceae bacterium]
MPTDPPRDNEGKIVPHNHPEILDEHFVIRHTDPHDLCPDGSGGKRISSGAYTESSDSGMSVDIEDWTVAAGLAPLHYITDPSQGAVRLQVGELRKLGLLVGWDPDGGHPHHASVWNLGGPKQRKRVARLAVTLRRCEGET